MLGKKGQEEIADQEAFFLAQTLVAVFLRPMPLLREKTSQAIKALLNQEKRLAVVDDSSASAKVFSVLKLSTGFSELVNKGLAGVLGLRLNSFVSLPVEHSWQEEKGWIVVLAL